MSEDPNSPERISITEFLVQELDSELSRRVRQRLLQRRQREQGDGSRRRPRIHIERGREEGNARLFNDYFAEQPVYTDDQFRRRFCMRRHVFLRVVNELETRYPYFQQRLDATGRKGFSALQKCTAAIRMLAYGAPADELDEYLRIGEWTAIECTKKFVKAVKEVFGPYYLRRPDSNDTTRLLQMAEARGFPGMLGSIDCMHWEWRNCPVAWKGQYTRGDQGVPTIMLEAVASQDLWIWHAFFGVAGSNNDLNVLNQSDIFTRNLQGTSPPVHFEVNGREYNLGYYLADGIYPCWPTFVKTIPLPMGEKAKLFAKMQEGARKDVERAFGVLQARFAIVRGPARMWDTETLSDIMYACIILHNMIVEDERGEYAGDFEYEAMEGQTTSSTMNDTHGAIPQFAQILETNASLHDRQMHAQLQHDLVEHIWQKFGGSVE